MTVTITARLEDITGAADNTPITVYYPTDVRRSADGTSIVTNKRVRIQPVAGVATMQLDPGPAAVNIGFKMYRFTVPDSDADLWPLIESSVVFPPGTPDATVERVVNDYLAANPPNGIQLDGTADTYANLPTDLGAGDTGSAYLVTATGLLYVWNGTAWPPQNQGVPIVGAQGPQGEGLHIDDAVPTYADLAGLGTVAAGYSVVVTADELLYVYDGSTWPPEGAGIHIGVNPDWSTITNKPATFPPTIGTTATTAKAGNYQPAWTEVTGKPSTFPPDAHTGYYGHIILDGNADFIIGSDAVHPSRDYGGRYFATRIVDALKSIKV